MAAAALQAGIVSIKHFALRFPSPLSAECATAAMGANAGPARSAPAVRPTSRALRRSRTPRWRRARAPVQGSRSRSPGSARAGSRVSSPGDHSARDQRHGEIVHTRTPAPKQARDLQLVHHP
jgi:hypothetical protein